MILRCPFVFSVFRQGYEKIFVKSVANLMDFI